MCLVSSGWPRLWHRAVTGMYNERKESDCIKIKKKNLSPSLTAVQGAKTLPA